MQQSSFSPSSSAIYHSEEVILWQNIKCTVLLWKLTHNRLFRISLIITTENILSWNIAGSRRSAAGLTGRRSKLIVGLTLMMKQKQLLLICRNDELWKTGSHFNEHIYRESQHRSVHNDNSVDLPNYREADYFPVFLSHLGQKHETAGKSVRLTLGMEVGLRLPFHFLAY